MSVSEVVCRGSGMGWCFERSVVLTFWFLFRTKLCRLKRSSNWHSLWAVHWVILSSCLSSFLVRFAAKRETCLKAGLSVHLHVLGSVSECVSPRDPFHARSDSKFVVLLIVSLHLLSWSTDRDYVDKHSLLPVFHFVVIAFCLLGLVFPCSIIDSRRSITQMSKKVPYWFSCRFPTA